MVLRIWFKKVTHIFKTSLPVFAFILFLALWCRARSHVVSSHLTWHIYPPT